MKSNEILDLVYQQFNSAHTLRSERDIIVARFAMEDLQMEAVDAKAWTLPLPQKNVSWWATENQVWCQFLNWYNYNYLLTNLKENPVGFVFRSTIRREYLAALKSMGKESVHAKRYRLTKKEHKPGKQS